MSWLASACIVLSLAAVQQSHSKEHTETAQPEKKQTTPATPEKAAGDSGKTAQPSERYQGKAAEKRPPPRKNAPWLQWKSDFAASDVVAVCALGVGFLTLLMTALFLTYTIKTWEQMKRSNDDAEKRYEESKGDIEESLQLTRDGQADTLRSVIASENQLLAIKEAVRARVVVDNVINHSRYYDGLPGAVKVRFIDIGYSAAVNAICAVQRVVSTDDFVSYDEDSPESQIGLTSKITFGIRGTPPIQILRLELTGEQVSDVLTGRAKLFVVGEVTYDDIFGSNQLLQYTFMYDLVLDAWAPLKNN